MPSLSGAHIGGLVWCTDPLRGHHVAILLHGLLHPSCSNTSHSVNADRVGTESHLTHSSTFPDELSASPLSGIHIWRFDLMYNQFHKWNVSRLLLGTLFFWSLLTHGHEEHLEASNTLRDKNMATSEKSHCLTLSHQLFASYMDGERGERE